MNDYQQVQSGLEGVVAAQTTLSGVDGEAGELIIGGFPVEELAPNATFEQTVHLLWHGDLPDETELHHLRQSLALRRNLPATTLSLLREVAAAKLPAMDALRAAAGTLDLDAAETAGDMERALLLTARFPTVVAAYWRLRNGMEPLEPRADLGHAANYLYMITGTEPEAPFSRGLETYLNTVVDHGLNASTFTARVIISTGSDMVSAVTGAVGALKGPLHGGAPGPALDMVFEIGSEENIGPYLRRKIGAGERLMGFGHRVYKVRDPRADVLASAADILYRDGGDIALYEFAKKVETAAIAILEEMKPGRRLQTNVEFYTALLLHGLRLPVDLFTPTFAVARVAGWIAHALEQRRTGRLIRPQSEYIGEREKRWGQGF